MKLLTNIHDYVTEATFVHKCCPSTTIGGQIQYEPLKSALTKYDLGFIYQPTETSAIGIKHETVNKNNVEFGKFGVMLWHKLAQNHVGSEFIYDVKAEKVDAKVGFTYRVDEKQ